jgi:hypothetical protein
MIRRVRLIVKKLVVSTNALEQLLKNKYLNKKIKINTENTSIPSQFFNSKRLSFKYNLFYNDNK